MNTKIKQLLVVNHVYSFEATAKTTVKFVMDILLHEECSIRNIPEVTKTKAKPLQY